jgi:succinate-acetate transporter protein
VRSNRRTGQYLLIDRVWFFRYHNDNFLPSPLSKANQEPGAFWFAFGGTYMPLFATNASVKSTGNQADDFDHNFAWFLLGMALLCLLYTICAFRMNLCLFIILFTFFVAFGCLSASDFSASQSSSASKVFLKAGGVWALIGCLVGWYVLTSNLFEEVDFPVSLPLGDLSTCLGKITGASRHKPVTQCGA